MVDALMVGSRLFFSRGTVVAIPSKHALTCLRFFDQQAGESQGMGLWAQDRGANHDRNTGQLRRKRPNRQCPW
jgi:hypothetical protein